MTQKINGVRVFAKALEVPTIEEVEWAKRTDKSVKVSISVYDRTGAESFEVIDIFAVKKVRHTGDGGFTFMGKIANLHIAANGYFVIETGLIRVTVEVAGNLQIGFFIRRVPVLL